MTFEKDHLVTGRTAVMNADKIVTEERSDEQIGLKCRWTGVNNALLKYWRFKMNYLIGGMSGSGKSYLLNMLRYDFLDTVDMEFGSIDDIMYIGNPDYAQDIDGDIVYKDSRLGVKPDGTVYRKALNSNAKYKPVVLHIGPEMPPADEYIRTASNIMGCSYAYLVSAQQEGTGHNKLTDAEHKIFRKIMNILQEDRKEYHYAVPPTLEKLCILADEVANKHHDRQLIVTVDHDLLLDRPVGMSEGEFIYRFANTMIHIRENYGAMVIPLHQLNGNIETPERRNSPSGHYPIKTDLHYGNQIWWASDVVFIGHQPSALGISKYGHYELKTEGLYHLACLKSRRNKPGHIWMKNDLAHGRIFEVNRTEFSLKK